MFKYLATGAAAAFMTATASFAISDAAVAADTNGDGVLTMEEAQAAFPEISTDTFTEMDANADGTLDEAEVTAAEEAGVLPAES